MNNKHLIQAGSLPIWGIAILAVALVAGGYYWVAISEKTHVIGQVTSIPVMNSASSTTQTDKPVYVDRRIGFSTSLVSDGKWTGPNTDMAQYKINGNEPDIVWLYAPDARANLWAGIAVWETKAKTCVPNFTSTKKNQNGLTVTIRNESDAAMGSYQSWYYRGIANGTKEYCVVGQVRGTRHYDLEGKAYDDAEKIDADDVRRFETDLDLFVDTFGIL